MISVIIPVYNIEKYIGKCIDSLLAQTYKNLEILLLDDGSTDNSLAICQKYQKIDQRIKLFHHANQGVSATRNIGLEKMTGDYVFFIDGDDWLHPLCFEKMMSRMDEKIDVVCCDFSEEEELGCHYDKFIHKNAEGIISQKEFIHDYYYSFLYMQTIWGKLYKSKIWENIRFKKLRYSEDTLAIFEVAQNVKKMFLLKEPYYFYLQRTSGASHQKGVEYYRDILHTKIFNIRQAESKYPDYVVEASKEYINLAYALLKIYERQNMKVDAINLISEMKIIAKNIPYRLCSEGPKIIEIAEGNDL